MYTVYTDIIFTGRNDVQYAYYISIYLTYFIGQQMLYSCSSGEGFITSYSRRKPWLDCSVGMRDSLVDEVHGPAAI